MVTVLLSCCYFLRGGECCIVASSRLVASISQVILAQYFINCSYSSSHNRLKRLDIAIVTKYGKMQKRFLLADKRECCNKYSNFPNSSLQQISP